MIDPQKEALGLEVGDVRLQVEPRLAAESASNSAFFRRCRNIVHQRSSPCCGRQYSMDCNRQPPCCWSLISLGHSAPADAAGSLSQPNSGLPEFGQIMTWPKSETSDFGWGEGVPPCRQQVRAYSFRRTKQTSSMDKAPAPSRGSRAARWQLPRPASA